MGSPDDDRHAAARLAQLCAHLAEDDGPLPVDPALRAQVQSIVSKARAGLDLAEMRADLDALHAALRGAGVAAGLGIHRDATSGGYRPLTGLGDGRPILQVLACPMELCTRVEPAEADACRDPMCQVLDQQMRRVRIEP